MNLLKTHILEQDAMTFKLSERQKKRYEYFLVALMILGYVVATVAQNNLNDLNVTVTSTFEPTIKDAVKFSDIPEIKDSVKKLNNLKYGISSAPMFPKYQVQQVEAAKIQNEPLPKLYHSLLKAGYSPFYNMPYGEFWIGNTRARESVYGAHLKHFSGTPHLRDVGYGGFSENTIQTYGKKFYKKHTLAGDFNYKRDVIHYYGYDTTINDLTKDFTRQRYQLLEPKLQLQSHYTDSTHINHNIKLSYYNLQNLHRETENNIKLDAQGSMFLNKEKLNLGFLTDFYNHKQSNDTLNNFIMSLNPSFVASGQKWNAEVGLAATLDNFKSKTRFYVYPQIKLDYNIYENMIVPYIAITGGLIKNSLRGMSTENPFVDTTLHYANTNNKINLGAGLKGNISSYTSYDAKFTYSLFDSLNYYVIDYSGNTQIYNRFDVVYDNTSLINVSGQLKHQIREKFHLIAKGNYYLYKPKNFIRPYHRPDFDLTFSGIYNLKSKFIIRADLFIMGNQWALTRHNESGTYIIKPKLLNGWGDLNLEAEYRYTKSLGFFLRFNNLAGQRYYRWERYPSQRFSLMAGLSFVPF